MLHAYYLGFEHPMTQKHLSFQSEPPADFQEIYELARI
jgi:23S rRNA-/tRNA-specific pseudouridylate synthase